MSDTTTGAVPRKCGYCGTWHTCSEQMCRDIHKSNMSPPVLPTVEAAVHERVARERERMAKIEAFMEGADWAAIEIANRLTDATGYDPRETEAEALRRYPEVKP